MSFALMNILPLCRCRFGPAHSAGVLHFMFSERRLIQLLIFLCPCTFPESASVGCGIQSPTLRKLQNPPLKAFMQTTPSAEIPWPDLSMASSASKKEGKMTSSFGSFPIQWGDISASIPIWMTGKPPATLWNVKIMMISYFLSHHTSHLVTPTYTTSSYHNPAPTRITSLHRLGIAFCHQHFQL